MVREIEFEAGSMLREIGEAAFHISSIWPLERLEIPSGCEIVSKSLWSDVESVTISKENPFLVTREDMLMSVDGKRLIQYFGSSETYVVRKECEMIGDRCFSKCKSVNEVVFEEGSRLQSIGARAFYDCGIKSIAIPSGVEVIGKQCFDSSKLCSMSFGKDSRLKLIENQAFWSALIGKIVIPSSVEVIGDFAFYECQFLSDVSFEEGSRLQRIGTWAFAYAGQKSGRVGPQRIVIPARCEHIGDYCFEGCQVDVVRE
jgi:hypothetical protein